MEKDRIQSGAIKGIMREPACSAWRSHWSNLTNPPLSSIVEKQSRKPRSSLAWPIGQDKSTNIPHRGNSGADFMLFASRTRKTKKERANEFIYN
jgi:hypothetical protein